jgi:hypothetical protein
MSSRRERWGEVLGTINDGFLLEVFGRYKPVRDYPDPYERNRQIVELWQSTNFERALVVERFSFIRKEGAAWPKKDGLAILSYEPLEFFSRE